MGDRRRATLVAASYARLVRGVAGGPSALGGTLSVSSGRFYVEGAPRTSADINLVVTQSGNVIPAGNATRGVGIAVLGTDGAVVAVPKTGNAYNLGGTDALRRRIGITTTPDGALLDGWFIKGGSGAVSELALSGSTASERELITGLGKPVGLAVVGDAIYVSDQNTGNILSYSLAKVRATPATLADGKVIATFTTLDGIDLMTAASDGTLFFGGSGGKLFRISPKGETSVIASGWPKIKGVAYDENYRRLFVAVSAADANSAASVRIVPVD